MARMRSIKPEFWSDRKLIRQTTRDGRLLYVALWNLADEWARLQGDVRWVKGHAFPYDDDMSEATVDLLLDELAKAGVVVRYEVHGDPYLYLPTLGKHQRLEPCKTPSRLPEPPDPGIGSDESGIFSESVATRPRIPPTGASVQVNTDAELSADESGIFPERSEQIVVQHVAGSREHVAGKSSGEPPGFSEFWAAYPRKDDKAKARLAFVKASKQTSVEAIVAGAKRYAADPGRAPEYTKLPATWLNAGAWENGPLPARVPTRARHEPRTFRGRPGQMAVEE